MEIERGEIETQIESELTELDVFKWYQGIRSHHVSALMRKYNVEVMNIWGDENNPTINIEKLK